MNQKSILSVLAGLGLLALASSTTPQTAAAGAQDTGTRLDVLEQELATTRAEVQELTVQLGEVTELVEDTVDYLEQQASGARDLRASLLAVEEAGFTAGPNWRSREILLEALRAWIENSQDGMPKAKSRKSADGRVR